VQSAPDPAGWGLHRFELPERAAPDARPIWRADVHPLVLQTVAAPCPPGPDAFDLAALGPVATLMPGQGAAEHLLLSDGLRALRIDLVSGSIADGPVRLLYHLHGIQSVEQPLLTLRRLLALCRTGRFASALNPREARAARWILMLRAHDALSCGASQREIAATLFGESARTERWRVEAPSLRLQAQRLVRRARIMGRGGYLQLLRG
jgi:hypothetical protein